MAVVELQLSKSKFEALALLVLSAAPIPVPTFTAIGSDRLIASMKWKSATVASSAPGTSGSPGTVLTKSAVGVQHLSVGELQADSSLTGKSAEATAWVRWTLTLTSLQARLIRFETGGQSQIWDPGLRIGDRTLAPPNPLAIRSAVIPGASDITLRYATAPSDDLLRPAVNRLDDAGGDWLVHVSSGIFVDQITTLMSKGLSPPPGGTEIEDSLNVTWAPVGGSGGGWGVRAKVGLIKIDACPALIEDVDVSVDVTATLQLLPDLANETLGMRLRVEGDASDWDAFRCWVGSGGLGSIVLGSLGAGLGGIVAAVGSLALIGELVQDGIAEAIAELDVGPLQLVESDRNSRTFAGSRALPGWGMGSIGSAATGPDGLSVGGTLPPGLPVTHQASFKPNSDPVGAHWATQVTCSPGGLGGNVRQTFFWDPIVISDRAVILAGLVDRTYAQVPVTVFSTSVIIPKLGWQIDHGDPALEQIVTITGSQFLAAGGEGLLILHTSAGIRRYEMDVPAAPPGPSPVEVAGLVSHCLRWTELHWDPIKKIKWLDDPPPYDFGRPPLRQWQLTFAKLPATESLALRARNGEEATPLLELQTGLGGPASLEVVTDASTELELQTSIRDVMQARVRQRWLLPHDSVTFEGDVRSMVRSGDTIAVVTENDEVHLVRLGESLSVMCSKSGVTRALRDRAGLLVWGDSGVFRISDGRLQPTTERRIADTQSNGDGACLLYSKGGQHSQPSMLRSIPLRENRVLAAFDSSIIIATPFGTKRRK
ncbi:hypothetical protein M1P56_16720 [Streptomyces sp. HU2014]|uniref:hypothetical protein n=1 Tax=Streptomyces sp. HU2014 TaxID=2939414 RepID=UPI00200F5EA3|nr:hypothetical protein [Streptomyces sp. HU2014]UQI45884.1 hypothetical protein M1P56_16720 [Streptomyces sp. HU2014]